MLGVIVQVLLVSGCLIFVNLLMSNTQAKDRDS